MCEKISCYGYSTHVSQDGSRQKESVQLGQREMRKDLKCGVYRIRWLFVTVWTFSALGDPIEAIGTTPNL